MKVLHINSSDFGGAGIAALRLHKAMLKQGIDSCFMSLDNQINDGINYVRFNTKKETLIKPEQPILSLKNYFLEKLTKRYSKKIALYNKSLVEQKEKFEIIYNNENFEIFSTPFSNYDLTESEAYKNADIIHLHWVAGYLDYPTFFEKNKKPIVWTIHDENPFRGGFHYKEDEIRNRDKYGDLDRKYYQIKLEAISKQKKLTIVSPSKWLAEEAIKSIAFKKRRVLSIYNTLDLEIFKPINKVFSRQFLGIPENANVFMFAAQNITNKRKGFDLLLPIIQRNDLKNTYYLIVGSNSTHLGSRDNIIYTGSIYNDRLMSLAYSAADFFILPSREDNLPNTMVESISCGTPVISFPIGDTKELLKDSKCGILAKDISTESLESIINECLLMKETFKSDLLANFVRHNFSADSITSIYKEVFSEIVN
jgi:glycosyltransferase involved in cell wall biosynthesis